MQLTDRQQQLLKRTFLDYMPTSTFLENPLIVERADRLYYWDTEGKRYFDAIGGIFVAVLGHGHPRIMEAMRQQLHTYAELGVDRIILNVNFGASQAETLDALRRFADSVMPDFA